MFYHDKLGFQVGRHTHKNKKFTNWAKKGQDEKKHPRPDLSLWRRLEIVRSIHFSYPKRTRVCFFCNIMFLANYGQSVIFVPFSV